MPILVYLASRYSRNPEMREVAKALTGLGFTVTSRWILGDHQINDAGLSEEPSRAERERFAREDLEDLDAASICISYTEVPRSTNSRGGRHVEHGYALARGKRCIVVGPRENVFHCVSGMEVYDDTPALLAGLSPPEASGGRTLEQRKAENLAGIEASRRSAQTDWGSPRA